MNDWKTELLGYAKTHGLEVHDTQMGVGIGFSDGCDVFWVLPGEVFSTIVCGPEGPEPQCDLIAEFETIDRVRGQVIHAVRHHLAEKNIRVNRCPSGDWHWEAKGGLSSTIQVGMALTRIVQQKSDVRESLIELMKYHFVGKGPSVKRMNRYLGMPLPPENERPLDVDLQTRNDAASDECDDETQSIAQAARALVACRELDLLAEADDLETFRNRPKKQGRIEQVLLKLDQLLPGHDAWIDMVKPGELQINFTDRYDSFAVAAKSREVAKQISEHGIDQAADSLAEQYQRLDDARTRVLNAIWTAAIDRNWSCDNFKGLPFSHDAKTTWLGDVYQEVAFDPGRTLTDALKKNTPDQALRAIFTDHPDFAESCVSRLSEDLTPATAPAEVSLRPYPPDATRSTSLLVDPTPERIQTMDQFVSDVLATLKNSTSTLQYYHQPRYYDPAIDSWCSQDEWVGLAKQEMKESYTSPTAVTILLDANDPGADKAVQQLMSQVEGYENIDDALVGIVWRYRHKFPEVAKYVFVDSYGGIANTEQRAKLGDPTAIRYESCFQRGQVQNTESDDDVPEYQVLRTWPAERQEKVRRKLIEQARTEHHFSPPNRIDLDLAVNMHWPEVAEALPDNPYMLPGLLTTSRRVDEFDEPGMLMAEHFILDWSRLLPNAYLATLLLSAKEVDLVALAKQASIRSTENRPELKQNLEFSFKAYTTWKWQTDVAMAIAWTRCRSSLTGQLNCD